MNAEPTGFLYPFIDAEERDAAALAADLASSARAKMADSRALRAATLERCGPRIERIAGAMVHRFEGGGRLFTFGNGGSATDAEGMSELFRRPPAGRPLPAMSLVDDSATLTAIANDVGIEAIFSRQLVACARAGDIAVGFSTSGDSANVVAALAEASRRDLLTVGFCGYDGGTMARHDTTLHCLVVSSDSVHRIQEAHDALVLELWSAVQRFLPPGCLP